MERAKEISILQSLKGDTYFASLFSDEDIDLMCENIRQDFAIESGLELFANSLVAKENVKLKKRLADAWTAAQNAAKQILIKAADHCDESLEEVAESLIGRKKCLCIKLRGGIALTEDDRDELLRFIDEK